MYVRYYMTPAPLTIDPEESIEEARQLLERHHFRHLPVVDRQGGLLGMVTDRDIRSAFPSSILDRQQGEKILEQVKQIPVGDIMSCDNVVLKTVSTLDDALLIFEKMSIGALPVLNDEGMVVGILSYRDLLKSWRSLFGLGEKGSALLSIEAESGKRPLSGLVSVLEEMDVPFTRLIRTSGARREPAMIYLRINTFNIRAVHKAIEQAGFTIHHPAVDEEIP